MNNYTWLETFRLPETLLMILKTSPYIHEKQPSNYDILLKPSIADINTYELVSSNGLLYHYYYYILVSGNKEMIGSKWKNCGNKYIRIDKKYSYEEIDSWELKNQCKMPQSLKNHLLNVSVIVNNNVFNIELYNEQLKIPFSKVFNENNCHKCDNSSDEEIDIEIDIEIEKCYNGYNGLIDLGNDGSGNYCYYIVANAIKISLIDKYIRDDGDYLWLDNNPSYEIYMREFWKYE